MTPQALRKGDIVKYIKIDDGEPYRSEALERVGHTALVVKGGKSKVRIKFFLDELNPPNNQTWFVVNANRLEKLYVRKKRGGSGSTGEAGECGDSERRL